mmetsp:Transcript_66769/g.206799  ORF Transcript_66769/g.206799 Transcript_66769/m.206799 type:complete len:380 (-) Transcript_66769:931-2070(-)
MIASVSFQFARLEEPTSFSKSLVMMLPTVDKNESAWSRRNSSRARVQSVVPPPEASSSASAIRPLWKQHSTAAARFPTRMDCLMIASGPADQSVTFGEPAPLLAPAPPIACSMSLLCSLSCSSCFFCSVVEASSSKKLSACVRSSSGPSAGEGCAAPAALPLSSASGGGPMSVSPGRLPRKRSASCTMRSWSKPSSAGTRCLPESSNCEPRSSHIRPSCGLLPQRLVLSLQYSWSRRSAIHCSNMSAVGTISGSLGTTREWQKEVTGAFAASFVMAAAAFFAPKASIFPPKPNETPQGFLYHRGQYRVPAFCCCWTEWMLTEPLNEAVDMIEGLCGAHLTSKFDCCEAISQKLSILPSLLLQQISRLSLPHDMMRLGSI